jgi:hypothetical protein
MNLLSEYQTEIQGALKNIFDTFKRDAPLRFYKPSVEEVVVFDVDFNSDLQEYSNPNVELTQQYADFYCVVIYPKAGDSYSSFIGGGSNIQVKGEQDLGLLKIRFEEDAYLYLKDCVRFTFMGENYTRISDIRKIGLLGTFNLYQVDLKKVN